MEKKRLKEKYYFFVVDVVHITFRFPDSTGKQLVMYLVEARWAQ